MKDRLWTEQELAAIRHIPRYNRTNYKTIPILRRRSFAAIAKKRYELRQLSMKPFDKYKTESDVKAAVKKLLTTYGWFWWMPPASAYGKSNVDFNALGSHIFLAIETKFRGCRKSPLTPNQLGFLTSIQSEGGYAFVVDEHKVESLRLWLEAFARSTAQAQRNEPMLEEDGVILIDTLRALTMEIV